MNTASKFSWSKGWVIALLVLIAISPIGILLTWNFGDAWGEWGNVGGWTPRQYWNAPLPDYGFFDWSSPLMASIGYILSAVIGTVLILGIFYGIGALRTVKRKSAGRKERE